MAGFASSSRCEGHVSLACMSPIVGFGAFAPLYINPLAAHTSILVNDLPLIVSRVQQNCRGRLDCYRRGLTIHVTAATQTV